jgi:hypothetical protein
MSPSRLSPRGSTLIEAMAALVVFTIGIIGVMQMNVLASEQNNLARSRTVASKIARDLADSFERLPFQERRVGGLAPFDHPLLPRSGLLQDDPEFSNMENPDGLVRLENALALQGNNRPLLGASDAMFTSEGDRTFYQVAWRSVYVPNPERFGQVDQIRILIMVRFPTPGGGMRQVNTWAVRYDVAMITGDPQTSLEL